MSKTKNKEAVFLSRKIIAKTRPQKLPVAPTIVSITTITPSSKPKFIPNTRILVADDEQLNQKLIKAFITAYQGKEAPEITIDTAENGQIAIDMFRAGHNKDAPYHLILMDIMMSTMGGIEAAKKIREIELSMGISHTPIIAATANHHLEKELMETTMDGFIGKPFMQKPLIAKIKGVSPNLFDDHDPVIN